MAKGSRNARQEPRRTSALRPVIGFVLRFAGIWIAALLLLALLPPIEKAAIANTVASLITLARWVGFEGSRVGEYLHIGGVAIHIVPDCTPLMPITSLAAAVLAFPAQPAWRIGGLLVGAAVLWLYNLLRIYALMLVLAFRPGWFDFIHVYLWQTITLVVVFAIFVLWLHMQRPVARDEASPAVA